MSGFRDMKSELPPMTIPEIKWEIMCMNCTRLRKLAQKVQFHRYSMMKSDELRSALKDAVSPDKSQVFDLELLNRVHEELR